MSSTRIEYVRIKSFPDQTQQTWKMQYYLGVVEHHGRKIRIGQATLDGKAKVRIRKKSKITDFNGFITDWLQIKQCRIIEHDVEFFNFISPPRKPRYSQKKNPELSSLNKLMTWQKNNSIEMEQPNEIRNTK